MCISFHLSSRRHCPITQCPHSGIGGAARNDLHGRSPDIADDGQIARPKFAAILARSSRSPERILAELRSLGDIVAAPPLPQPICRDPDDDAVLACALAARADLIVSGDDDLRVLAMFKNIPIVATAEALARLDK